MDGWMDGWMDVLMDGRKEYGWVNGEMGECVGG